MDRLDIEPTTTRVVPCGKCPECLTTRANHWAFRLYCHGKHASSSTFLTLTYSDDCLPFTPQGRATLQKRDFQLFMKRLRKKNEGTISYYACGEYGSRTARPHYHALVYNLDGLFLAHPDLIQATWNQGNIYLGNVQLPSIRYVVGYIQKGGFSAIDYVDESTGEIFADDRSPEFALMSKNLGLSHLTPRMVRYYVDNQLAACTLPGGILIGMPRYYREKIFSKAERYQIAQANKEIRDLDLEKFFNSPTHEVSWKRDQLRKADKKAFERQKF